MFLAWWAEDDGAILAPRPGNVHIAVTRYRRFDVRAAIPLSDGGGAERESGVPHFESKRKVEERRLPFPDGIPLEMLAVRDLGRAAASVLLGAEVPGGAVEIGGDKRTGSQIAEAFGEAAGLPARYEALPLEAVGADSDMAAMFRWFAETPVYQADFEATRALVGGDGPLDLPGWIRHVQWTPNS